MCHSSAKVVLPTYRASSNQDLRNQILSSECQEWLPIFTKCHQPFRATIVYSAGSSPNKLFRRRPGCFAHSDALQPGGIGSSWSNFAAFLLLTGLRSPRLADAARTHWSVCRDPSINDSGRSPYTLNNQHGNRLRVCQPTRIRYHEMSAIAAVNFSVLVSACGGKPSRPPPDKRRH